MPHDLHVRALLLMGHNGLVESVLFWLPPVHCVVAHLSCSNVHLLQVSKGMLKCW